MKLVQGSVADSSGRMNNTKDIEKEQKSRQGYERYCLLLLIKLSVSSSIMGLLFDLLKFFTQIYWTEMSYKNYTCNFLSNLNLTFSITLITFESFSYPFRIVCQEFSESQSKFNKYIIWGFLGTASTLCLLVNKKENDDI